MIAKYIGMFVAGAAVGGTGMYIYLTKFKKVEYEIVRPAVSSTNEEESQNDEYDDFELSDEDAERIKDAVKAEREEQEDPPDKDLMEYFKEAQNNVDTQTIDYSSFSRPSSETPDPSKVPKEKAPIVYEIEQEDFIDNEAFGHEKYTVALYDDDAVVDETDARDEAWVEEDIESYITFDLLDMFKNDVTRDEMYVRNLMFGADYEVYKRHEKWAEIQGLE